MVKHQAAETAALDEARHVLLYASSTKLTATLLHALNRRRGRYDLQTMREGGGMANVTIFEALT